MKTNWQKQAKPEKVGGAWRIRRSDGALVGFYVTKALAQKFIDRAGYLD